MIPTAGPSQVMQDLGYAGQLTVNIQHSHWVPLLSTEVKQEVNLDRITASQVKGEMSEGTKGKEGSLDKVYRWNYHYEMI